MYANEEINEYVNNRAPDAIRMGLEEFAQHRRRGPDTKTTDADAAAETRARLLIYAITHQGTRPKLSAVRSRLTHQHLRSSYSE